MNEKTLTSDTGIDLGILQQENYKITIKLNTFWMKSVIVLRWIVLFILRPTYKKLKAISAKEILEREYYLSYEFHQMIFFHIALKLRGSLEKTEILQYNSNTACIYFMMDLIHKHCPPFIFLCHGKYCLW